MAKAERKYARRAKRVTRAETAAREKPAREKSARQPSAKPDAIADFGRAVLTLRGATRHAPAVDATARSARETLAALRDAFLRGGDAPAARALARLIRDFDRVANKFAQVATGSRA